MQHPQNEYYAQFTVHLLSEFICIIAIFVYVYVEYTCYSLYPLQPLLHAEMAGCQVYITWRTEGMTVTMFILRVGLEFRFHQYSSVFLTCSG